MECFPFCCGRNCRRPFVTLARKVGGRRGGGGGGGSVSQLSATKSKSLYLLASCSLSRSSCDGGTKKEKKMSPISHTSVLMEARPTGDGLHERLTHWKMCSKWITIAEFVRIETRDGWWKRVMRGVELRQVMSWTWRQLTSVGDSDGAYGQHRPDSIYFEGAALFSAPYCCFQRVPSSLFPPALGVPLKIGSARARTVRTETGRGSCNQLYSLSSLLSHFGHATWKQQPCLVGCENVSFDDAPPVWAESNSVSPGALRAARALEVAYIAIWSFQLNTISIQSANVFLHSFRGPIYEFGRQWNVLLITIF